MKKERAGSLLFLLFGIYGFILSLRLPLGHWREPGPGFLPLVLSILLCVSGALGLMLGAKTGEEETRGKRVWRELGRKLITPGKIIGVTTVYAIFLERAGYLLASVLYAFVLFYWISQVRLRIALVLAILIGGGSWYFFGHVLGVPLPQGILNG
jgi:putative tricarboxylic transport membrane protein